MSFIHEDFLLQTPYAQELYHSYAKNMPIIDYHNHLTPELLANDGHYPNMARAWLDGDHYKWRAMRALGIEEKYITGNASDQDKFLKWAEAVPYLVRNPLYHWTHLELQRFFGITDLLSKDNALEIYQTTSAKLQEKSCSALGMLQQMNVEVVCTTDDPIDDLRFHQKSRKADYRTKMLPAFRPDKAYAIENLTTYKSYLEQLSDASGITISSYSDVLEALKNRIAHFHENGCRLADHGLEQLYFFEEGTYDIEAIFKKMDSGQRLETGEIHYYKFQTLVFLCREYHSLGWAQQFHLGPLRNVNQSMLDKLGPDTGFDSIGDKEQAYPLGKFLNLLESTDQLAKTILYNLNPSQNEVFATMAGNFNRGGIKGKIQYGSGWWYLDQLDGMEKQINTLSNLGVLSTFIGMLTDSRSLLSFPRHEYFRRLLCNILGNDIQKGLLPADLSHLGSIVQDICYNNAKDYFNFDTI